MLAALLTNLESGITPSVPGSGVVLRRGRGPVSVQVTVRISIQLAQREPLICAITQVLGPLQVSMKFMQETAQVAATALVIDEIPLILSLI